jgi:uncharacterized glyoxalase superfamily protein PhnB
MSTGPANTRVTIIPALHYRDAPAAIEFLCAAFGFERHLVVPGENGTIVHAQLRFGNGMIMLGSARDDDEFGALLSLPDQVAGKVTQTIYVVVADADAHFARAQAADAAIVTAVADQSYGGRLYTCRDPEGHIWSFGTYDPWQPPAH